MGDGTASNQLLGANSTSPTALATGSRSPPVVTTSSDESLPVSDSPSDESQLLPGQQQQQDQRNQQQQAYYNASQFLPDGHHGGSPMNVSTPNPRSQSFNMSPLGAALPDGIYANYGQHPQTPHNHHRFSPGASVPAIAYQIHQVSQYAGHAAMAQQQPGQPPFSIAYTHQQFPPVYNPNQQMPQPMHSPAASSQYYPQGYASSPSQQQQVPPYFYTAAQYGQQGQSFANASFDTSRVGIHGLDGVKGNRPTSTEQGSQAYAGQSPRVDRQGSATSQSSAPRGPPRKPKQSGHALWVGNLPPGTSVMDLKDHFSRDAKNDIESVFLISKSNCAFVNYKTEAACAAAMSRFHDSRFQGVRLVCRLRRSSANTSSTIPTGPASTHPSNASEAESQAAERLTDGSTRGSGSSAARVTEKFFVVKSLTVEDLELSVRNGIWATQSHNEEALNSAYKSADNVYLIFSANKSGEYFGYARMTSQINDDPAAAIEFAPKPQGAEESDSLKAIPTPATEFAPKGRVIDDSARGTIFWEAESTESDVEETEESDEPDADAKTWGKPFKVEWLSTVKLPFYRTRGMRNPWNSNREVKIARDGTELETSVGRRLLSMFHRDPSPNPQQAQVLPGMPLGPMMGRYNQQGPF